jgi:hypothetical protein
MAGVGALTLVLEAATTACAKWLGSRDSALLVVWLAFGLASGMAVAAEIGQGFVGRSQNLQDVLRSLLGAAIGAIALLVLQRPIRLRAIAIGLASALALAAWPIWDSSPVLMDAVWAYRSFPVLSDFSSPWESRRWMASGADLERQESAEDFPPWVGRLQVSPDGGGVKPCATAWRSRRANDRQVPSACFPSCAISVIASIR